MGYEAHPSIIESDACIAAGELCPPQRESTLNGRQQVFVEEYLIDLCATRAAIRAGYSKRTAGSIGQELLKKPEIAAAVDRAMTARAEKTGITAERVVRELAAIASADIAECFTPDGTLKPSHEIDEPTRRAIKALEMSVDARGDKGAPARTAYKIRLHDKLSALEKLGRHVGLFNRDQPAQDEEDALTKVLREARGTTLRPIE